MSSAAQAGTKGVPRVERERQIVAHAVAEFAADGYAGASMARIARRAGISKPLIYQYFGSKDGLYLTCLHAVAGALLARLEEAELSVDDTLASRVFALQAVFEALEPQREAWKLLYDVTMPSTGPIAVAAGDYQQRTAALAASGSERFLRARGLANDLDAAALSAVWMGLVDSLVLWWLDHPRETAQDMVHRCTRLVTAVLSEIP
jgi:AcrR family transcriptional regulator